MDKLTIDVCVPQRTAVFAGVSEYGVTKYTVTDKELSELGRDHRQWLLLYTHQQSRYVPDYLSTAGAPKVYPGWQAYGPVTTGPLVLDAAVVSWDAIVEAIRRDAVAAAAVVAQDTERAAQLEADRAARAERARAWLDRWCAMTDDLLVSQSGIATCTDSLGNFVVSGNAPPRDDFAPEDRTRYDLRYERLQGMLDAIRVAAEREKEAIRQKATSDLLAYAASVPELAQAAAEGYDVGDAAMQHFAAELAEQIRCALRKLDAGRTTTASVDLYVDGSKEWQRVDWSERRAPSPRAFDVRHAVVHLVDLIKLPEPFDVTISRIKRIKLAGVGLDEHADFYTGFLVEVSCAPSVKGCRDRILIVSAE